MVTAATALLLDGYSRVQEEVHAVVDDLTLEELHARPDDGANSIGWLVWHLTRIQDDHVAGAAGTAQVWTDAGWADRFALPFAHSATGYGQHPDEVAAVRVGPELLAGYHDAVHARTAAYVGGLSDDDLAEIVNRRWDPPVTLAVRLVSVLSDDLQHAGQAAYVRGMLERR